MGKLRVYCLKTLNKLSIYPIGNTPSAPSEKRWGTKTFDEGMQTDGESEEDGMEGKLCAREERHLRSIVRG